MAEKGDYIIKGVKCECYPCKPDIFHKTKDEFIAANIGGCDARGSKKYN